MNIIRILAIGSLVVCCTLFVGCGSQNNDTNNDTLVTDNESAGSLQISVQSIKLIEGKNTIINQPYIEPLVESLDAIEVIEPNEKRWTEAELEMLACTIYREAGADYISDETRLMVGCVVLNRVEHELYPDTIYEVLTQKSQYGRFYWTGIVWPERAKSEVEIHAVQRAFDIAERVLNGERLLGGDYIFQSEFKQSNDYIYQDGIYFCRYIK